jgi:phosphoglucomutase
MLGAKVTRIRNFETETIRDVEGDEVPKQKMSIFELADGARIAVRGSGTEPKIKYYIFDHRCPKNGKFSSDALKKIKAEVNARLEMIWDWLQKDVENRLTK